jgi:mono/diheme cytochrome c family protein
MSRAAGAAQPADVTAGLYMARLADCVACHTRPGGTPFAGGREIGTPFGSLSSPNITPDPDTGIGGWSDDAFYQALHDGIGHGGEYLYPVMPYPSYTRMTREDVLAIKAYLDSLKPVFAPRVPNGLDFPFDIRATLFVWRELFFRPGTFEPNPKHSAEWNRGAYIVQGPGHCGACHSPRDLLGATETSDTLAGGAVQQWLAPNISSNKLAGLGDRSVEAIVTFLHTGADRPLGVAFGPMAEVVHDSLRYATEADLRAIAVYLKEGPDRAAPPPGPGGSPASVKTGQTLYLANCAGCHQDNGRGIPGAIPNLAGNAALAAEQPNDVIVAVLQGLTGTGDYGQMPSFAGAFSDQQVADIVNYVRSSWHDKAPANATPALVASLRAKSNVGAAGTEAARDFDCPRVGSGVVRGTLATAAEANFLATDDGAFLSQRISELVAMLRRQQPGISDAHLVNTMNAAFCPAVANRQDLSTAQKRTMLLRLNAELQRQIAAASPLPGSQVVASVPLPPAEAQLINNAAAARHLTPGAYMAELIRRQVKSR